MIYLFLSHTFALELDEALKAAWRHSPQADLWRFQADRLSLAWPQALSTISPRFQLQGNITRNQQEISFDPSMMMGDFSDLLSVDPVVVQPLYARNFSFRVVQPLIAPQAPDLLFAAHAQKQLAQTQKSSYKKDLFVQVAEVFVQTQLIQKRCDLQKKQLLFQQQEQERAAQEYQVGTSSLQDKLKAEISIQTTSSTLLQCQQQHQQLIRELSFLTKKSQPAPIHKRPTLNPLPKNLDILMARVLDAHPIIKQQEQDTRRIHHQIQAQKWDWLPSFNGVFTYSYANNIAFSDQNFLWSATLQSQWNIWDGGLRLLQQKELHIQKELQMRQYELSVHQLQEQVAKYWNLRELSQKRREENQIRLQQLRTLIEEQESAEGQLFSRSQQRDELNLLYEQSLFQEEQLRGEYYLHSFRLLLLSSPQPFTNKPLLE